VLAVAAAAAFAVAASAAKGPSSKVAWTPETVKLARSGDPAHGKKLHDDCSGCHGPAGDADTPDIPNLAGQDVLYLYKQLQDYKAELRASPIMGEAVKTLSEKDMADLAAFYASQKPARTTPGRPPSNPAAARLASRGDGARLIVSCDACHGEGGAGNPGFYGMPSLRNQKFDDLSLELTNFRSGDRANDVYRVMRDACRSLTDAEIEALAAHYSGTAPPAKK
jgi:cytochrome c553